MCWIESCNTETASSNLIQNPKSQIQISMTQPLVGIIMGSDSDLPTMQAAIAVCEEFGVPYEVGIVSAHRTPERMVEYAQQAHSRGIKVIIAGAGGAAHLPGMVASLTPLPVIGVPVATRNLQGVDSLYSIVQMPAGIPVATVAIGNAKNAGLLAVQILATSNPTLLEQVQQYRQSLKDMVMEKQAKLDQVGYQQYLKEM
jgi:5-(carboxyamino)imidazole ribonucleotide mutase